MSLCATSSQLELFLSGGLSEPDAEALCAHVTGCPACQGLLERLSDDPELRKMRPDSRPLAAPPAEEPELARALRALRETLPHVGSLAEVPAGCAPFSFLGPPQHETDLGTLGPYRILERLGQGGMGIVFKAYEPERQRTLAIKVLKPDRANEQARARFAAEALAVVGIAHDHVVPVYAVSRTPQGLPYFVMPYVPGATLSQRVRDEGRLGAPDAARVGLQIAEGLAAVHGAGVVHRDVKPGNVLLDAETGRARIADFGLVRSLEPGQRVTHDGQLLGTPEYMSPEQVGGHGPADARTDVYGLGMTLYEALTGSVPFRGPPHAVLQRVLAEEPKRPRLLNDAIPRDLETIVLTCIAKEPARRYQTAQAVADDLRRFLASKAILARPASRLRRVWMWARRRPAAAALIGVSVLAALLLAVGGWVSNARLEGLNAGLQDALREARALEEQAERERRNALEQERIATEERDAGRTVLQRVGLADAHRFLRQRRYSEAEQALARVPPSRRGWECRRLAFELKLQPRSLEALGAHDMAVSALLLSKDGLTLVSSGHDGRVIRWDTASHRPTELESGAWSEDKLRWLHFREREPDEPREGPTRDAFHSLCWVKDGELLAGASHNGKGVLWGLRTGQRSELLCHDRPLYAVAASPDGNHLLFGDSGGTVRYHDRRAPADKRLALSGAAILGVAHVSPGLWVVGQADGKLSLLDLQATRVLGHVLVSGPLWGLAPGPDGTTVAVAGATLDVYAVDPKGSTLRRSESYLLPEHETQQPRAFQAVRFSADGNSLAAGDDLGRLMAWKRKERLPEFVRMDQKAGPLPGDALATLPLPCRRRVAALAYAPDGRALFAAGHDTAIKRWAAAAAPGTTEFTVGKAPRALFDPADPRLLWVGDKDGKLSLWDSRDGKRQVAHDAHPGAAITGLALAADGKVAATCGTDKKARFWARDGTKLRPTAPEIACEHALRSVALTPDGARVAAYDEAGQVHLWEVRTGQRLGAPVEMKGEAVAGLVAFSADGNTLGVAGGGQSFWLFSGTSLAVPPRKPYVVAGEGGTAIAWHPKDPNRVVAGDTIGRIRAYPLRSPLASPEFFLLDGHREGTSVAGLSFTPDGERLAAVTSDGKTSLFDHRWIGVTLTLQSPHAGPTGALFDAGGQRLAVIHGDGRVVVWETGPEQLASDVHLAPRRWRETVLREGGLAPDWAIRLPALRLDRQDRLHVLYARPGVGTGKRLVLLGRETGNAFREERVAELDAPKDDPGAPSGVGRSLALSAEGDDLVAVVRRPRPDLGGIFGELVLYRQTTGGPWRATTLGKPANHGFDTHLVPGRPGEPAVVHFAHDGHYLCVTRWSGAAWKTFRTGRQGDGYNSHGALGKDGRLHLIFGPNRFGGDPSPLTSLRLGPDCREEDRTPVDGAWGRGRLAGPALGPDGLPTLAYARARFGGPDETVVARRGAAGWSRTAAPAWVPAPSSNLTCDAGGALRFLHLDGQRRRVLLVTRSGNRWRLEQVWGATQAADLKGNLNEEMTLKLLNDSRGRPVVVAGRCWGEHRWLRAFRPQEGKDR